MSHLEGEKNTILIVDDVPENLQLLIDILGEENYSIRPASDGEFALKYANSERPDLILLDIRMPGMNGYDVCRNLKKNVITKDIPVIFISAADDISDIKTGFNAGGIDYITKPFNDEEVILRVKNHLTMENLKKALKSNNEKLEMALARERKMVEDLRLNLSLSLPHELRTPLNGILGFSELLAELTELPSLDEIVQYAKAINASGKRLFRLVENSLIYADLKLINYTAENGGIRDLSKQTLDIKEIVENVCRQQAQQASRESDLVLNLNSVSASLSTDNLEKIIRELMSNAFFFSEKNSKVKVVLKETGNWASLEITDQGVGLTQDQIKSIGGFMQFQRNKHAQQGMGFGLAIVNLLTNLEGGKLEIQSKKAKGSTFKVKIPAVKMEAIV